MCAPLLLGLIYQVTSFGEESLFLTCKCAASLEAQSEVLLSPRKGLVFCCSAQAGRDFVCTSFSSVVTDSLSEQGKQGSAQLALYQETGSSPLGKQLFFWYIQVIVFSHFSSGRRKERRR